MNSLTMIKDMLRYLEELDESTLIEHINEIKKELHKYSPFKNEPVDCVIWANSSDVTANDYNPNKVAPPEMKLLEHSIRENGYTQPIVTWKREDDRLEVIDGFHRNRVGTEVKDIKERIKGYLPVVIANENNVDRGDRIAATIRHNRARGKHTIDGMAEIVLDLKRRNWSDKKIARDLGMDPDEILRLSQITGLAEMFADRDFSEAWEAEVINMDDNLTDYEDDENIPQS